MTPALLPTSELVAQAWIASIAGMQAGVATQLPADTSTWSATGFVTVAVVGGNPDVDVPIKKAVIQADCWACDPGSNKPPWLQAADIAEQVTAACYDRRLGYFGRPLTITNGNALYPGASVMSAAALTEARRIYGDVADYATYSFDLQLVWRAVSSLFPID